jgi:hypothetical protein
VVRWQDLVDAEPAFASRVRERLDERAHKLLATVRADGSPRVSGIEAFIAGGELWFGSLAQSRKTQDLRRDPRFELHSGSLDPPDWTGDAKVSGTARETDPVERGLRFHARGTDAVNEPRVFRAEIDEAVLVQLNDWHDKLIIELWRPGEAIQRIEREL